LKRRIAAAERCEWRASVSTKFRAHKANVTQLILRSVKMTVINGGMATDETDDEMRDLVPEITEAE